MTYKPWPLRVALSYAGFAITLGLVLSVFFGIAWFTLIAGSQYWLMSWLRLRGHLPRTPGQPWLQFAVSLAILAVIIVNFLYTNVAIVDLI